MLATLRELQNMSVLRWVGSYVIHRLRCALGFYSGQRQRVMHILFCFVDHFEPIAEGSTCQQEWQRMQDWMNRYPILASRHRDSDDRPPQHTWFYPGENYRPEY